MKNGKKAAAATTCLVSCAETDTATSFIVERSPSSLGLGISIACLFLEASRAKSISFSSYVRSSFDPASMSRRTFSTCEAEGSGSDTAETRLSKEKLARPDVSFIVSARSRFAAIFLDVEFRVASPLERPRIRTTNRDRFVRFCRAYLSAVDA